MIGQPETWDCFHEWRSEGRGAAYQTRLTSLFTMTIVYSTYEAKARFSELLRLVREGQSVTVTYRGEPVAEVRPIRPPPKTLVERLDDLERRGILVPFKGERRTLRPVTSRPGALDRFLAEREG